MILLLGITKIKKRYLIKVIDTDEENNACDFQIINPNILKECVNIDATKYSSNQENPLEYLKADFDIKKIFVDKNTLTDKVDDFQILTIYYDDKKKPSLYKSIDREGNVSIHDISELEYAKNSIFGNDLKKLPKFVEHRPLKDAYQFLSDNINIDNLKNMPVRLVKQYLIGVKGFSEAYHSITKVNNGIELDVHEYMLFNQTALIKLIEYIPKGKNIYLTKQDLFVNCYPKERTVGFLSSPLILLGNRRAMVKYFSFNTNIDFSFYDSKVIKMNIPFDSDGLYKLDRLIKAKDILCMWHLNFYNNLTEDVYKIILPNEISKLSNNLCNEMKKRPFWFQQSSKLAKPNINIELWIHTVSLFVYWQCYSIEFKKKFKLIIQNFKQMYIHALNNLVLDLGPKDALFVMKWTQKNLKEKMEKISESKVINIEENECLFSFFQNEYDLPECLRIFSEETILAYGGIDKLKKDYEEANQAKREFIINSLESIAKDLQINNSNIQIKYAECLSLSKKNNETKTS